MNLSERLTGRTSYGQYYRRLQIMMRRPGAQVSALTILTIITVSFFVAFAILPTFQTIAGLKREIKDAKTVESKLQQKIHSLTQAEKLYEQILPGLEKLDQTLPAGPDFEKLAWQLHWLASRNQVLINSGSFSEFPVIADSGQLNSAATIELTLALKGNYAAVKNYLTDLGRLDRLIAVQEAVINNKSVRSDNPDLNVSLKLTAYYLPAL